MHRKTVPFFTLLFLFCLSYVFSETKESKNISIPKDNENTFKVGFSMFSADNLQKENRYLIYSLPLILRENLISIGEHTFSKAEKDAYKKRIINREIASVNKKLRQLISARDNLFLSTLSGAKRDSRLKDIDKGLNAARDRMNFLRELDKEKIEFPDKKPIEYADNKLSGKLIEPPKFSPMELAKKWNVDLLIWGIVEQVDNILYIRIDAYEAALDKSVFSYIDAGSRENVYSYLKNAVEGLSEIVLGHPWGSLVVETNPSDSAVYINGVFRALGNEELKYLSPGKADLRVVHDGYENYTDTVNIEVAKTQHINAKLKKIMLGEVKISTNPPGASVYINSVWKGLSPVVVDRPQYSKHVVIKYKNYAEEEFSLSRNTADNVNIILKRKIIPYSEIVRKERDQFYSALGLWLVSIPIPIFAYGFAIDYKLGEIISLANNNNEDSSRMALSSDIMYYSYLGGLFINASLFLNGALHLFNYIKAVNE